VQKSGALIALIPLKVVLLVGIVLLAVKIDSEKDLVFEAFSVPPALEEKGYAGAEVVRHLNDQMETIRTQVQYQEEAIYMQIPGMQDALQLEMPGTGISLSQITNLISHFVGVTPPKISGSLTEDEQGFHLTIRISGQPTIVLHDAKDNPRRLMIQAAEYVLKHLEPFLLGRFYVGQQRYQDALDLALYLRAGLRPTQDTLVTADLIEGWAWYKQQQFAKALRFFNQAFRREPDNVNVLMFQGYALDELGRSREAIEKYQQILESEPENVGALNNWGIALYHLGQFPQAIGRFRRVTQLDPFYPDAYNNWGFTLFALGDYAAGITQIQEAIRLKPQEPEFHLSLAEGIIYLEEYDRAVQKLYAVLSAFPHDAKACQLLMAALYVVQETARVPPVCQGNP
jgi:tetratricopeptide (TPR) repeat protein